MEIVSWRIGAIQVEGGHNIVIEGCDISDWDRLNPTTGFGRDYDAAVFSRSPTLQRLIRQRSKLHHPRWDDGLEVEGGSRNVRVWDNYITQCMI